MHGDAVEKVADAVVATIKMKCIIQSVDWSSSRKSLGETETWCRAGEQYGPLHFHAKARLHVFELWSVMEMRALCRLCHARAAQLAVHGGHYQVVGTTKQMLACLVSGQFVPVK